MLLSALQVLFLAYCGLSPRLARQTDQPCHRLARGVSFLPQIPRLHKIQTHRGVLEAFSSSTVLGPSRRVDMYLGGLATASLGPLATRVMSTGDSRNVLFLVRPSYFPPLLALVFFHVFLLFETD